MPRPTVQVAEPLMPILCSMPSTLAPFRAPTLPSASKRNFGTMKIDRPFVPAGASGARASTRWTTFEVMSLSPPEMKIFSPVSVYLPSSPATGTALARLSPTAEPAPASVRHIVPDHSPVASLATAASRIHAGV